MQIKIECIRVMKILMKVCTPQSVIDILLPELSQKNAKIREDVVNFVIVALLKFPSQEFDLLQVCSAISPSLIHAKRRVRQSAFECMATIHQVGQITCINQSQKYSNICGRFCEKNRIFKVILPQRMSLNAIWDVLSKSQ